jgi:Mo-dependent nitrogenase C-terminus
MNALNSARSPQIDLLSSLRQWIESIKIVDSGIARLVCQFIPARCPFERKIQLFNRTLLYIPPLCKLNPLYEQLVELRYKSLCYLADECGEDVTIYC